MTRERTPSSYQWIPPTVTVLKKLSPPSRIPLCRPCSHLEIICPLALGPASLTFFLPQLLCLLCSLIFLCSAIKCSNFWTFLFLCGGLLLDNICINISVPSVGLTPNVPVYPIAPSPQEPCIGHHSDQTAETPSWAVSPTPLLPQICPSHWSHSDLHKIHIWLCQSLVKPTSS